MESKRPFEWLDRLGDLLSTPKAWLGLGEEPVAAKAPRSKLVKDRPASLPAATLEDRYQILELDDLADEVFQRLRSCVYAALNRATYAQNGRPQHYREMGRLASGGRQYFYVQPMGRTGLLFERSGAGWLVSPAERIVHQQTFLRSQEPIDHVVLYIATDTTAYPRVRSTAEGDALLALAVYEQRLLQRLGLGAA